jgi:predicted nucleic acid-binding Zn ribbon protein
MSMDEIKRNSNETPLSEVIDKLLRAYRLDGKMKELDVIEAWPEMMGIAVANRTKEISIRNKVLYLTMDSSVMRDELSYGKQIIIQRINQKAGFEMITDVWFG